MQEQEFQDFLQSTKIYKPEEIYEFANSIKDLTDTVQKPKEKVKYLNIPCAFDIETSSFFQAIGNGEEEKVAIMYEWTLGMYGKVIIGRTWSAFKQVLNVLIEKLDISIYNRLLIYVHSLSYEFQFIRKLFDWKKVFSLEVRKPIYALTEEGVEFRCSYLLSGYSLETLGKNLRKYSVKKLVGSLDYEKIRHSGTPLTQDEIAYCVNDVKVVMAYIAECIISNGKITSLPLTKTGYVRNYCREVCFHGFEKDNKDVYKYRKYREIMRNLTISPDEYDQLRRGFQGGFVHANPFNANKVLENVTSFDFTSSYPTTMVAEMFPMSKAEQIEIKSVEEFYDNLKYYCCLFTVAFEGLESVLYQDSYISSCHCGVLIEATINNGRVVSADKLVMEVTEQDFLIIKKFYKWKKLKVGNFKRYKKGYLPTDFVKAILKLYGDKTTLKGVVGKEEQYLKSKEMLNSCYGMAVTSIVRPEIIYKDDWEVPKEKTLESALSQYNNSTTRFLFYPWGVWVTAYARRNLFTGIVEFGSDYVYSDTDSIKVLNAENHLDYIEKYNNLIKEQLYAAMDFHKLPYDLIEPQTIKGVKKPLGVWDFDGHYQKFKTLGAKRYMVQYSNDSRNPEELRGKHSLTVAGLGKKKSIQYLLEKYGETGIFEAFEHELYIPSEFTDKNTHTYIDEVRSGVIEDYLGIENHYCELSAVHLEKAAYSLSIAKKYRDYLLNVETTYI